MSSLQQQIFDGKVVERAMGDKIHVGATVRVLRLNDSLSKPTSSKATIATIQTEENTATVLFEPLAPRPLFSPPTSATVASESKIRSKRRLKRCFLVTPMIEETGDGGNDQEMEATIDISDIAALLDFEQEHSDTLLASTFLSLIKPETWSKPSDDDSPSSKLVASSVEKLPLLSSG